MCDTLFATVIGKITTELAQSAYFLDETGVKQLAAANNVIIPSNIELGKLYVLVKAADAIKRLTSATFYDSLADMILAFASKNEIKMNMNKEALVEALKVRINEETIETCVFRWNSSQGLFLRRRQFSNLLRNKRDQISDISHCLIDPNDLRNNLGITGDMTNPKLCVVADKATHKALTKGESCFNNTWLIILIIVIIVVLFIIWYMKHKKRAEII